MLIPPLLPRIYMAWPDVNDKKCPLAHLDTYTSNLQSPKDSSTPGTDTCVKQESILPYFIFVERRMYAPRLQCGTFVSRFVRTQDKGDPRDFNKDRNIFSFTAIHYCTCPPRCISPVLRKQQTWPTLPQTFTSLLNLTICFTCTLQRCYFAGPTMTSCLNTKQSSVCFVMFSLRFVDGNTVHTFPGTTLQRILHARPQPNAGNYTRKTPPKHRSGNFNCPLLRLSIYFIQIEWGQIMGEKHFNIDCVLQSQIGSFKYLYMWYQKMQLKGLPSRNLARVGHLRW